MFGRKGRGLKVNLLNATFSTMHCRLLVNWSQSFWWFVEGQQDGLFCRPSCRCWSPPPPCWTSPPPPPCLGGSHPSSLAERGPDRRLRKHCNLLVPVVFKNILLYVLMSVMKSRDYDFGQKTPFSRFIILFYRRYIEILRHKSLPINEVAPKI